MFAWQIDKIFQSEQLEEISDKNGDVKELRYRNYLSENTPWILKTMATCIVDLPNIEQIATGSFKKII